MSKRKRSDESNSDSNHSFPTLLELCSRQFARELWKRIIKQNTLPSDSSKFDQTFIEHCKGLAMEKLREYSSESVVARCQSTIVAQVNRVMGEMMDEFSPLIISRLISYVLDTPKWNEFLLSIWCCLKEKISEQRIIFMFESLVMKVDKVGLKAMSEDELAMYVHIWKDLSKPIKFSVFDSCVDCHWRVAPFLISYPDEANKIKVRNLRHDLRFLSILLAEFDLSERRQIWFDSWLNLVFGTSPSSLESLMKMCCEHDEPIEQFKEQWLAKNEIIDVYYRKLVLWQFFDELNALLSLYSADESKVLDLAARILRSFFSLNMSNGVRFSAVAKIAQYGQWLGQAIRMPEFEYYLRKDDFTIRTNWCWLLLDRKFDSILDYMTFFVPDASERLACERRYLRGFFLDNDNDLPMRKVTRVYQLLYKLDEFDALIGRIFDAVDEAADFKKQMISSPFTMEGLRRYLDTNHSDNSECIQVQKFVTLCLPDERDLSVWKERFMRDALRYIRLSYNLAGLFRLKNNFMTWCLDSPEKRAKFKTELPIDDLYLIMERFVARDPRNASARGNIANNMLRWWFGDDHQMAAFKVKKLKRCATRDPMFRFLLNNFRNLYRRSQDDEERMTHALASCTNQFGCS